MSTFWVAAGALSVLALAILLGPLWVDRRARGQWSISGLVVAIAIVPLAFFVYSRVSNYDPAAGGPSNDDLAMVRQLAARLEAQPDNVEGWMLLGRSYTALGQYRRAREAFTEAWNRTSDPGPELKLSLGEAMIYTEPASARAEAGDLIEQVLSVQPTNQRALWWGGLVAAERDQPDTARRRWNALLASNPPPEVVQLLQQQLALLPAEGRAPGAGGASAANTGAGPTSPPASSTAPPAGLTLNLAVSVAANVPLDRLGPNSYVFIFARAPGGGPPIAGIRLSPDQLPGTFMLSDANAIIAGRSLTAYPEITIVARVAVGGDPIEQPGDLVGETVYRTGDDPNLRLTIDRVVE